MKKKLILIMFVLIIIILAISISIILNKKDKREKEIISQYSIKGIDVSAYQGEIDWEVLASQNIQFAFIKATEGSSYVDEKFSQNLENAKKTDLKVGAYHFFSYDSEGKTQADNFIKNVPKDDNMLPPVVDIEFYGDKEIKPPEEKATREQLRTLIEQLEKYYEKEPIIYATQSSYKKYIDNNFDNYIWIRDVYSTPKLEDDKEWKFWQFTDKVKLPGYKGKEKYIDMNVFNGYSLDEFIENTYRLNTVTSKR